MFMIVTLIEKIYSFLWGDLVRIPLPDFIIDHFVDSNRNLFYDPDSFSSDPTVS